MALGELITIERKLDRLALRETLREFPALGPRVDYGDDRDPATRPPEERCASGRNAFPQVVRPERLEPPAF